MYEYVNDIIKTIENKPIDELFSSRIEKHGINMCLTQIGEQALQLRKINPDVFSEADININKIVGMRNRIVHSYDEIDYEIITSTLQKDIPKLKQFIEENVNVDILNDPYALYEDEYEDYVKKFERPKEIEESKENESSQEVTTPKKKRNPRR